ncbi:nucleotide exchange factor GrpE [Kitasatospora sp. NPDC085464]|uniref:nucleotide exchange factor GrpE n=1 Tax=Kitasatospora sp. NPDC085464 TaxID=3364063 RepID=UPI0037CB697A
MTDAPTASPLDGHRRLEIPPGVEEVDLERKFVQLLFRSSLLGSKLTEQRQTARAEQRDLLGILVEVDDALAALGLDRELVALGRGEGIEATRRRLLGRLAKAKVRPMRLEGMPADPELTEIVGTEVRPGVVPETVVRTVVTGFFWEDEVLRRAQVVVAAPEPERAPDAQALQSDAAGEPGAVPDGPAVEAAEAPEAALTVEAVEAPEAPEAAETTVPAEAAGAGDPAAAQPVRAQPKAAPPRARRKATAAGKRAKRKK